MSFAKQYCITTVRVICIIGFFMMAGRLFMDTSDRFNDILAGSIVANTGVQYLINLIEGKEEWR